MKLFGKNKREVEEDSEDKVINVTDEYVRPKSSLYRGYAAASWSPFNCASAVVCSISTGGFGGTLWEGTAIDRDDKLLCEYCGSWVEYSTYGCSQCGAPLRNPRMW